MNTKSKQNTSILLVNLAVMMFGLSGVISRSLNLQPIVITFWRVFFSSIFLFLAVKVGKGSLKISGRKNICLFLGGGIIIAIHWISFISSVKIANVAIGTVAFSTFPIFLIFIKAFIFKEKIKLQNILLAFIVFAGVIISVFNTENFLSGVKGVGWGILSSITYAFLSLINENLSNKNYSGKTICFYEQSVATVILLPFILNTNISYIPTDWLRLLVLGIVCTALAYSLYVSAFKKMNSVIAGIISGMETVYGILFALIFLGDIPSFNEILGAIIIVSAIIYLNTRYK